MTATDQVFCLPDLGEGLTEAEVVRWLVAEGDDVATDQPVVEVETAKSLVEVPSPYAGTVAVRHAEEGATLEVGKPLLTVRAGAAEAYRAEERAGSGHVLIGYGTPDQVVRGRRRRPRSGPGSPAPASAVGPVRVSSPLVRRLARDHGVDLRTVAPSGPDGVIVRADVERSLPGSPGSTVPTDLDRSLPRPAATTVPTGLDRAFPRPAANTVPTDVESLPHPTVRSVPADVQPSRLPAAAGGSTGSAPAEPGVRRTPLTAYRKAVAAGLSRSRAEIPEATVWVDVDFSTLWQLRESARTPHRPGPGLIAYLARFVVSGLRKFPVLNARLDTDRQEIVEYERVDLGIAVQADRGLLVPAVVDAGSMTTAGLDDAIRSVVGQARAGRATAEAGTFTLNNYGAFRVDGSAAIINHPQVAILGFGRIIDRPWVVDGQLCVRKIAQMSFAFDHRVCDGGTAAAFMRHVADAIENPVSAIADL